LLVVASQYIATDGVFGVPLKVSTEFVFLFVLFGSLLEKAGAGKFFIDIAYAMMGRFRGGPAKAAVLASGMNGLVSGSSIANTVTTGTFTIPLMKKVGLPDYKAGAVEVAASTNGQLMPPIMGAAAFIMAETIGIPYIDVVRAAFIPAVVSYIALFWVVHLEAMKLGLKRVPRKELPPFLSTFLRGVHYLIPVIILITYLVVLRRSAITSCLLALEAIAVVMLLQRPMYALLMYNQSKSLGTLPQDYTIGSLLLGELKQGVVDVLEGLVTGARNMIPVGVATATAGIIVGVVISTGLAGRFVMVIDTISMGNIYVALVLTALTSMFLGMGLPTTANYIMMASLTAPVIVQLGGDAGLVFPVLAAHLFVFYFGILADDTPPVGLAAYAASAIAGSDPIKTGIQGFTYDMRTAILPFVFLLNIELLMMAGVTENGAPIWIHNWFEVAWIFGVSILAMFAFASAVQGYFACFCSIFERILLGIICFILFRPDFFVNYLPLNKRIVQVLGLILFFGLMLYQKKAKKDIPQTAV
jgi:TRAP transporter 4TM/12TM fusion protein